MPKLFLDFGNADVKWFTGYDGKPKSGYFRHALAPLSERKLQQLKGRATTTPEGILVVNGNGVAIGDSARRHTIKQRPTGASRYTSEYYGAFMAQALVLAIGRVSKNPTKIALYASHAPQDVQYARDIQDAVLGNWHIETPTGVQRYEIVRVETFDEPLGGFNHYVLTTSGRERKQNPIANSTVLVVDVGGHTVDVVAVDAGGQIDLSSLGSTRTGVIQLKKRFEEDMRNRYSDRFKKAGDLDERRIEFALLTGFYQFGNQELDVISEVSQNISLLTNDVIEIIEAMGGAANYDSVLLTGGGAALIENALSLAMPEIDFVLVEDNRDDMRFANVYGAAKLFKLLETMGLL